MILTMTVDDIHRKIDTGSAMIYRTRRVKLHSKKKLPKIPNASDVAFSAIPLSMSVNYYTTIIVNLPLRIPNTHLDRSTIYTKLAREDITSPGGDQRNDRHETGEGAGCRCSEGDCSGCEPPVLRLVVVWWSHVEIILEFGPG